jgi:hypothetical protein
MAKACHFEVMLFHAINNEIGIMKVVSKIKDNEIPSTPNTKFQLSHSLNSTKHWNNSPFKVLSNTEANFKEITNTAALINKLNQREASRLQTPNDRINAPIKGTATRVDRIFELSNILK